MSATEPTPDRPSEPSQPSSPSEPEGRPTTQRPARPHGRGHRPRRPRAPRPDLEILTAEPALASLRWQGWQLDSLPTTSVGWAFAGALGTSLFAFGAFGAALVVIGIVVALLLAGSAVLMRDVPAARATLHLARVGLLGCLLVSAAHL